MDGGSAGGSRHQQSENHELQAFLMQNSCCSEIKDDEEDFEDGFKKMKGGFNNREKMMGSTIRDLGNTIKEAKNFLKSKKAGELQLDQINQEGMLDDESALDSQRPLSEMLGGEDNLSQIQHQMSSCLENADEEDQQTTT